MRILNQAAATWAKQARFRRRLWWAGATAAAAAAVVLVVMHLPGRESGVAPIASITNKATSPLPGDIDRNGRVDILDAFAVARDLRDAHGKPLAVSPGADLNGDGVIDQKDVDLIAQIAVHVGEARVARSENAHAHSDAGGTVQ